MSALARKELMEFRANPVAILPVAILLAVCNAIPFVLITIVPRMTGQPLGADREIARVVALAAGHNESIRALPQAAAAEAFLLQQFLLLFLLAPIVGAVSLAAYSVVGEKQARTLEPLLTTPITAAELLVAKVGASFAPSLALEALGLAIYVAIVAAAAQPGVLGTLVTFRSAVLVALIGPLASLAALQMTIAVSARVNDPRTAQQVALLVVLPIVAMVVGQIAGLFFVPVWGLLLVALALAGLWMLLLLFSVALFDRETILTRWK